MAGLLRIHLLHKAARFGFLKKPCGECGQYMLVARSGKRCLNCDAR